MPRAHTALLVACALALAACKAHGTTETASTFCADWATAFCMQNSTCCTDPLGRYPSASACEAAQLASCSLGRGVAFQSATPTAFFDSARATDAVNALRMASCTSMAPSLDTYDPPIVRGTLGPGADCSPIADDFSPTLSCAPTFRCLLGVSRSGALRGQCVPEGTNIGASCAAQTCIPGLYCQLSSTGTGGTCQMQLGPGQACTDDVQCFQATCDDTGSGSGGRTCSLGFTGSTTSWCVRGASFSTPPADGGGVDAGTPPVDMGTPPVDMGAPPVDMGAPPVDMGGRG